VTQGRGGGRQIEEVVHAARLALVPSLRHEKKQAAAPEGAAAFISLGRHGESACGQAFEERRSGFEEAVMLRLPRPLVAQLREEGCLGVDGQSYSRLAELSSRDVLAENTSVAHHLYSEPVERVGSVRELGDVCDLGWAADFLCNFCLGAHMFVVVTMYSFFRPKPR